MTSKQEELTRLGFMGLIPFGFAAIVVWLSPWLIPSSISLSIHQAALVYGAIIAAYMAGMGAGVLLVEHRGANPSFLPGMVATIVAWLAISPLYGYLSLGAFWKYVTLILVLIYLLLRDRRGVAEGTMPVWYGELRMRLTFWACSFMVIIAGRLLLMGQY